jgi:hypothetical protein
MIAEHSKKDYVLLGIFFSGIMPARTPTMDTLYVGVVSKAQISLAGCKQNGSHTRDGLPQWPGIETGLGMLSQLRFEYWG